MVVVHKYSKILFYGLVICLFMPKIDIIKIPYFYQGIRYDDIFLLAGIIYILFTKKLYLSNFPLGGNYFVFYGTLIFIALISSFIYGITPILLVFKWIEYSLFFVLLHYASFSYRGLHFVTFSYILLNFILVLLQKNEIIGCITSVGYKVICHDRPTGISGGAWELPVMLTFMIIPVIYDPFIKVYFKIFFMILTTITIYLVETRTGIIVLIIALLLSMFNSKTFKIYLLLIFIPIIAIPLLNHERMGFIFPSSNDNKCTGRVCNFHEETFQLPGIPYLNTRPELTKYIPLTMIARLQQWSFVLVQMDASDYIFGKGLGFSGLFKEGMYIKILTDLGIVGVLFFVLFYYKLLKHFKVLGIVLGIYCLTIDILSASKGMISFYFALFYLRYLFINQNYQKKYNMFLNKRNNYLDSDIKILK